MISRAARHDPRCSHVEGGTFHHFGYKCIRMYADLLGLAPSFTVLDAADATEAVARCAAALGAYDTKRRFPQKHTLQKIISKSINCELSIPDILTDEYPHFADYADEIAAIRAEYTRYKVRTDYVDFDDLLVYLEILLEEPAIGSRIASQVRYVMVDEYQDTNGLQGEITYLLGKHHGNVMVVGDDAQSIYRFRGAEHKNILDFPKRFAECATITLEKNYRSTQSILNLANALLENMKEKYSKCLTAANGQLGNKPELFFFNDPYEEGEWIADRIKELRDEGVDLRYQAVLYRAGFLSLPVQVALRARDLPYQVFGGIRFTETAHVKDLVAHLKILVNLKDELAWNRILTLLDGIGPKTALQLTEHLVAADNLAEAAVKLAQKSLKRPKSMEGLRALAKMLLSAESRATPVGDQCDIVLDYYRPILKQQHDDWPRRLEDLEMLRQIASRYSELEDLLGDLTIEPPELSADRVIRAGNDDEEPLTLSTIHSAKGLEWQLVFILGVSEGSLPSSRAVDNEKDIEEEHRLCYVAVTRGKKQVFLPMHGGTDRHASGGFKRLSRFIAAPNVLQKIEQRDVSHRISAGRIRHRTHQDVIPVLRKDCSNDCWAACKRDLAKTIPGLVPQIHFQSASDDSINSLKVILTGRTRVAISEAVELAIVQGRANCNEDQITLRAT